MPRILTVSIITYNHEATIAGTINSIIAASAQAAVGLRILVRDQGSQDRTVTILKEFGDQIEFEIGDNLGYGGGHNALLDHIDSPKNGTRNCYHLILNPDIDLPGPTLKFLLDYLDEHTDVAAVSPQIRFPDGQVQYLNRRQMTFFDAALRFWAGKLKILAKVFRRRMQRFEMRDTDYSSNYSLETMTGCFMLYRLAVLKELGGFDPGFFLYFEDTDLSYRTSRQAKIMFIGQVHAVHHWGKSQYKSWKPFVYYLRSLFRYFNKWGWKLF